MTRYSVCILLLLASGCAAPRAPWADGAAIHQVVSGPVQAHSRDNLAARLLALHNRERAAVGVPPLVWDTGLAAAAASYGPALAALGDLRHSPTAMAGSQGENLWMGTRGAFSVEDMAGSWAGEKRIFRAGTFPNVTTSGNWSDVGHYTQMIWRGTTRVGCALHQSPQWDFLICRYAPAGNVTGQPVP